MKMSIKAPVGDRHVIISRKQNLLEKHFRTGQRHNVLLLTDHNYDSEFKRRNSNYGELKAGRFRFEIRERRNPFKYNCSIGINVNDTQTSQ